MSGRLVILDRDGVINHDSVHFIKTPDEWIPIDGSLDAIADLSRAGYDVAVATNQSGVGRKLLDRPTLEAIHDRMKGAVSDVGGHISEIAYCPHHPDDGCDCRKPRPGLIRELARRFGVPLTGVPVVGDSVRDIEAAQAAGARPILVRTGNGLKSERALATDGASVEVFDDLAAFVATLLAETRD